MRLKDTRGFSIDKDTDFPELKNMHLFYIEVVMGYCYSNAVDYEQFCTSIYRYFCANVMTVILINGQYYL